MGTEKAVVTVLRMKGAAMPEVRVFLNDSAIGVSMALDDFLVMVAGEMGNPAMLMTNGQLLAALREAADLVDRAMREKSVLVV